MSGRRARPSWLARHRIGVATAAVVALGAGTLVIYAAMADGNPPHYAALNDAGVWVTTDASSAGAAFGQVSVPTKKYLNAIFPETDTNKVDVLQAGAAVLGWDTDAGTLTPIDPNTGLRRTADAIQIGPDVAVLGGNDRAATLAVLNPDKGQVWLQHLSTTAPPADFGGADPSGKPILVGANAAIAVGVDGVVHTASLVGGFWTLRPTGGGFVKTHSAMPSGLSGTPTVTAVGSSAVVLVGGDSQTDPALVIPGHRPITVAGGRGAILQQPGAATSDVYLETASALISVGLASGTVRTDTGLSTGGQSRAAAPFYLRGCVFAAWANGSSAFNNRNCGSGWQHETLTPTRPAEPITSVVYRTNHGYLLLNDPGSGAVFTVDGNPQQVDSWEKVHRPKDSTTQNPQPTPGTSHKPPIAVRDDLGAREGTPGSPRVTVLHVLDNDSVGGGAILSVASVTQPGTSRASVRPSPDGLSILLTVQADAPSSFSFKYTNNNGNTASREAAPVNIKIAPDGTYVAPNLRLAEKGTKLPVERVWTVPTNGALSVPVLNDWRNNGTGDPVALDPLDAAPRLKGRAITTTDGSIEYQAPSTPGTDTIAYTTSDGTASTKTQHLLINVIDSHTRGAPPVANSDYTRTAVGSTFTLNPLLNDLPGSDPSTPNAQLAIQGKIRSAKKGLEVVRQAPDGTLTLHAVAAGPYSLTYLAAYGSLVSKQATIRIDVRAANKNDPIAAGVDTVTVHGNTPALVDVLVNDFDPDGQMLTVVGTSVASTTNLTAAVVQGRWVRVNVGQPKDTSRVETLTYTVADGVGGRTATGQIQVNELPQLPSATPLTVADYATVRHGDEVTIPVLDNDITQDGSALGLQQDFRQPTTARQLPHGQLPVTSFGGFPGSPGRAYVSGNSVRFVAPNGLAPKSNQQVQIKYRVLAIDGSSQTGTVFVTITPPGTPLNDHAPIPQDIEARVVSGGSTIVHIPTSGVDPDGDTVQLVGLAQNDDQTVGPRLGHITRTTANSMTYEAFPSVTTGGTDVFRYAVVDTYGLQSSGAIYVSVVQPTVLPPPVPHAISVSAAPGTTINVKVVTPANVDYPEGDAPTLVDPSKTDIGAAQHLRLAPRDPTSLQIPVPRHVNSLNRAYTVRSDAGRDYKAGITVHVVDGYVAPPVAVDQFAHFSGKPDSVKIQLLVGDFSQVAGAKLSVTSVGAGTLTGSTLTVPITGRPQIIPYVIQDTQGGEAAAIVYVPAGGTTGLPYWNGQKIMIPHPGRPYDVDIRSLVKDPAGRAIHLTTAKAVWTAPQGVLSFVVKTGTKITLTSGKDESGNPYQGPAALTFPVITGKDINAVTYITVPVIVGNPSPVLRCPADQVRVTQDQQTSIDIATECHVWTADGDSSKLAFDVQFKNTIKNVRVARSGVHKPVIAADSNAPRNATGTLTIGVHNVSGPKSQLGVVIVPADPLRIAAIPVQTVDAGVPTTIALQPFLSSPFNASQLHLVGTPTTHGSVRIAASGKTAINVTPQSKTDLTATVQFTIGDNNDHSRDQAGTLQTARPRRAQCTDKRRTSAGFRRPNHPRRLARLSATRRRSNELQGAIQRRARLVE